MIPHSAEAPGTGVLPRRVVVVGDTGSGKSTLAQALAELLGAEHIELDALHWGPKWTPVPDELFRERVSQAVAAERWVADGNYSVVRDLVWPHVDTWIWLDYSYPRVFWQLLLRTWHRTTADEALWAGNRESLRQLFFDWKNGLFAWQLKTHWRRRRSYEPLMSELRSDGRVAHRFKTRREAAKYVDGLTGQVAISARGESGQGKGSGLV